MRKNSRWLDAMIPTLVCRPKIYAGKISLSFCRKGRGCAEKNSDESSVKILISLKKEFKLFYCVLLGKRISRKSKEELAWLCELKWSFGFIFLFCSNQVPLPSEMKMYTAKRKPYLESRSDLDYKNMGACI